MHRRFFPQLTFVALMWGCLAGIATAELKLEKDPENVVASRLEGSWQVSSQLAKRLSGERRVLLQSVSFKSDPTMLAKVPAAHAEAITAKSGKVYFAGYITFKDQELPFLLTTLHGNPHIVLWMEQGGDRFGNIESMNIMLAVAEEKQNDLMFLGGDFNNQPFNPYERVKVDENQ